MFPVLYTIFGIKVYSYFVMIFLGVFFGYLIAQKRIYEYGLSKKDFWQIFILVFIFGIFGARIVYLVFFNNCDTCFRYFLEKPFRIFYLWKRGFSMAGMAFGATFILVLWGKWKKKSFFSISDCFAPSVALTLSFAKIGCFLNGCCYGKPTNMPWGVIYPVKSPIWNWGTPRHPVQLYESILAFLLFEILFRKNWKSYPEGTVTLFFGIGYSSIKFLLDFYRGDVFKIRGFFLTWNQVFALMLIFFLGSMYYFYKK